jgi:putative oxidoreductase
VELMSRPLANGESESVTLPVRSQFFDRKVKVTLLLPLVSNLEDLCTDILHRWSIPALRVMLGLVFIWFGALKIFGVSPVMEMLRQTYTFLPSHSFVLFLGGWEMLIGSGLVLKRALRCTLILMGVHLIGTFVALWLAPTLFFLHGNLLLLTTNGEFVMKNLVLVAAGLVIGGYELEPLKRNASLNLPHRK